ncbi:hypothetical protein BJF88_10910 [Cellulosimicrobium sp. CUA-896]|nr:hypothetical protein BJF88_10910 [Cellulosimicrobium sp. CUA-896]
MVAPRFRSPARQRRSRARRHGAPPPRRALRGARAPAPGAARRARRRVRLETTAAPKDFGTELRLRVDPGTEVDVHDARQALRLAKQLLETGTVMPPDEPLVRRRTLTSLPLEAAIRRAGTEGRL